MQRLDFLEWLGEIDAKLPGRFHQNVDIALIRNRKMTINNKDNIRPAERSMLVGLLKKFYEQIDKEKKPGTTPASQTNEK